MKIIAEFFYGEPQLAVPALCLGTGLFTALLTRSPKLGLGLTTVGLTVWHHYSARLLIEDQRLGPILLTCPTEGTLDNPLVWLTFDDGPGPETLSLVEQLNRANFSATFFFIGEQVEKYADLKELKILLSAGEHTVANHSYSHPNFLSLTENQARREMQWTQELLEKEFGELVVPFFRPPFGYRNAGTLAQAGSCGLTTVGWTANSLDFLSGPPRRILRRLQGIVKPGSILLFHDGRQRRERTLHALPQVLQWLKEKNFESYRPV